ncbi:hypothetical protein ACHAW5_008245 [Stephanodiscus triporus]|uniref:N-acetyltransferase domain-containing protein n=1 Tax=Stephanodiscus triporus TaxID=2934178 RepID=A0ABD3Q1B2_9STRA
MVLSFATFCRPFNIDIRPSPTNPRCNGSRIHLFDPLWQKQKRHGDSKRNDRRGRSTGGGSSSSTHRVPEANIHYMGGGFGPGRTSPPFPYEVEMMPPRQTTPNDGGNDRPDRLIIRHLEEEDIASILPEIVREFGSLAPAPEPGDELSSKVENYLFSLTVLIGLTQRVKRRKEGYSNANSARPDHNVVCLVESHRHSEQIVGIAELSWQPPNPNSNAPPYVLPYYAKALLSRFFGRNNGDATTTTTTTTAGVAVPGGYVSNVLVWKTRRGRGYGRLLMAALEGIAKIWGCDDVRLHVDANENSGRIARELYSSLGYVGVPDRGGTSTNGIAGYGWMGPSMANQGLYLVDGVPLLYLRKSLKEE